MTVHDRQGREVTSVERIWRCSGCGHEAPNAPRPESLKPRYGQAMTHACEEGVIAVMHVVERERVYASEAERRILANFEKSDWGLLAQAAKHYNENRRRTTRSKNPGAWRVMEPIFARLSALERACNGMRPSAPADSDRDTGGGRIVAEFPS